mgnify:CR=1
MWWRGGTQVDVEGLSFGGVEVDGSWSRKRNINELTLVEFMVIK